jgi:hypothetical protein
MEPLLDTNGASQWLTAHGVRRSPKTLRKLRCVGGGPKFRYFGGRPYYIERDLSAWIEERLSEPFGSTSEADADANIREAEIIAGRRAPAVGPVMPLRRGRSRGCGDKAGRSAVDRGGPATMGARAGPVGGRNPPSAATAASPVVPARELHRRRRKNRADRVDESANAFSSG